MHVKVWPAIVLAATVALGSCGEPADGGEIAAAENETGVAGEADTAVPDLFESAAANEEAAQPASAEPVPTCPDHAFCEGPLVVRSDQVNLVPYRRDAQLTATFAIENRTSEDLRVIAMSETVAATLDNGVTGSSGGQYIKGLEVCRGDGADCFATQPERLRLLRPGDSPATISASMNMSFAPQMAPSMKDVSTATISFQLYSVSASGEKRLHQVALSDVPVQNRMAE